MVCCFDRVNMREEITRRSPWGALQRIAPPSDRCKYGCDSVTSFERRVSVELPAIPHHLSAPPPIHCLAFTKQRLKHVKFSGRDRDHTDSRHESIRARRSASDARAKV